MKIFREIFQIFLWGNFLYYSYPVSKSAAEWNSIPFNFKVFVGWFLAWLSLVKTGLLAGLFELSLQGIWQKAILLSNSVSQHTVVVTQFLIRHVGPPAGDLRGRYSEAETLRTQRKVVDGQFGLGAEAVRAHEEDVISAKKARKLKLGFFGRVRKD